MQMKTPNQIAGIPNHEVKVDHGKYTFVLRGGWELDVLRHGQPWVTELDAPKAVSSMMAELDAARVVVQAVRDHVKARGEMCPRAIVDALAIHDGLVDDQEKPSAWAIPVRTSEL